MTGKIIVVNKYKHSGPFTYIGRGSVFGNPYPISMGRDECIEAFRKYMEKCLLDTTHPLTVGMQEIYNRVYRNEETVYLGCFCKPKHCHGDIIKEHIDSTIRSLSFFGSKNKEVDK